MRYQMKQKNIKERSENKVDRTLMQELAKIEGAANAALRDDARNGFVSENVAMRATQQQMFRVSRRG
eukprot:CAMPEP_0168583060 /NCGR_PEP_ID=MMETSP0420-20121227/2343_1 /TAXON_ID=498008 /ORGANISM="Pessonella sp." /LENGTH=66 /DNA_ID=CAMNT_0008617647 /DNA_START=232 /DNA_END=428 /DNA_ORIENTATION=+